VSQHRAQQDTCVAQRTKEARARWVRAHPTLGPTTASCEYLIPTLRLDPTAGVRAEGVGVQTSSAVDVGCRCALRDTDLCDREVVMRRCFTYCKSHVSTAARQKLRLPARRWSSIISRQTLLLYDGAGDWCCGHGV